jgi:uncharacterized small protein (DUF1192 family)
MRSGEKFFVMLILSAAMRIFLPMFDEELPKPKTAEFPRNLDGVSIDELQDYISDLKAEITRVEDDIAGKKASQNAAASFFK